MKWPWVSRILLEEAERHSKIVYVYLQEVKDEGKELRARIDSLTDTITTMRREEGFEPPTPPIELEEEDDLPDAIWAAINEVSSKDSRDYFVNLGHARKELNEGTPTAEIVERILKGLDVVV